MCKPPSGGSGNVLAANLMQTGNSTKEDVFFGNSKGAEQADPPLSLIKSRGDGYFWQLLSKVEGSPLAEEKAQEEEERLLSFVS